MFSDIRVGIHASMCPPRIFDIRRRGSPRHAFQEMERFLGIDMLVRLEV